MLQVTSTATPTPPPTPQSGNSLGDAIRKSVDEALSGTLAPVRAEMQSKLAELQARREGLSGAMDATTSRPARLEIQRQIADLDRQIAELERGIAKLDARLTTTRGGATYSSTTPAPQIPRPPVDNFDPTPMVISIMGILFVAFPLTLALVRFLWKRATGAPPAAITAEQARRFDRLEQSVDAIAIEVERISENQRYLTKLLGESKSSAKIGA